MLPEIRLKVRVHGRHPWFYRKMVRRPERPLAAGCAVQVVDREGRRVGVGFYNPRTELALRMLSREELGDRATDGDVDGRLLELLDAAITLREQTLRLPDVTDGYRLVHSEGDGFPGLVLDRLGDVVVAQLFTLCLQDRLESLGERLLERHPKRRLVLTVDEQARTREGIDGIPKPRGVEARVVEHGVRYAVHAGVGHKTGFFADQRENRQRVRGLARRRRVLDLFCNSGGFALNAAAGDAREVVAADLDEVILERATENARSNSARIDVRHADAFDVLRDVERGRFDLIVLDPPKWASGKGEVEAAIERYRDINRLAFQKCDSGALVLTCSCSGAVPESRFAAAVRDAAAQARRDVRVLGAFGAGPDHPVALECPETRYLKTLLLEVRT